MDLELWAEISAAISSVDQRWPFNPFDRHPTSRIVRVHLWSVLHDRPTCWACKPVNWTARARPGELPDQSTMSRRMRRGDFERYMTRVGQCLNGTVPPAARNVLVQLRAFDGKALELPNHTTDRNAKWGRGVSRISVGYKLHMIWSAVQRPMPDAFVITSLDRCEKRMAARLIRRVEGPGYLLADAHLDASWLFDHCREHGHQLVTPRAKPGTGISAGHRQAPDRIRSIELLESPANLNPFGATLYAKRTMIERQNAGLVNFGGGIAITLPSWVRRIWRARRWVTGKLFVNAARIRINQRKVA